MIDDSTVFLIGSGPSLNKIDIKKLKGHKSLALNRSYIAYDDWGFNPTFYFICDQRLLKHVIGDIHKLINEREDIEKFIMMQTLNKAYNDSYLNSLKKQLPNKIYIIDKSQKNTLISKLKPGCNLDGAKLGFSGNAGACSLHALYLLGFKKIVLLGIDANYIPREESVKKGEDLSHFHPKYFDVEKFHQGITQGSDNHESETIFWEIMSEEVKEIDDLKIYSSTPNSPINEFFEYVEFNKWFENE